MCVTYRVQNVQLYSGPLGVSVVTIHGNIHHHHIGAAATGAAAALGAGRGLMPFFFINSVTCSGISASTSLARYAWLSDRLLP